MPPSSTPACWTLVIDCSNCMEADLGALGNRSPQSLIRATSSASLANGLRVLRGLAGASAPQAKATDIATSAETNAWTSLVFMAASRPGQLDPAILIARRARQRGTKVPKYFGLAFSA